MIGQKLEQVADLVYEKGKDAEWNEFWDNLQERGDRTDYNYAFAARSWKNATFRPKYDFTIVNGQQMFYRASITDIVEILNKQGIVLDTSKLSTAQYMFAYTTMTRLPHINISSVKTSTMYLFAGASNYPSQLHTIEKLTIAETTVLSSNSFSLCNELVQCIFDGTVACNCDIHWSKKLSRASILSLLQCMNVAVTGVTITLPSKCIDTATDTLALIQGDTELNTAYTQASANGYSISFL